MKARDYLKVIRRKWPVMVACAVAAGLVMWVITPANPPEVQRVSTYTATATLLVNSPETSLERVSLFITTGEVPQRVAERVGYTQDPAILASQLQVMPNVASMSLTLTMTGSDPQNVTTVTNAFAEEAVDFFETSPSGVGGARLQVLQAATPIPVVASGGFSVPPSRPLRTSLAALLGLLIGFGLALLLHQLDSRLRTRDEVYESLRMPVVAEIPKLSRSQRENAKILVADEPHGVYADGYRTARAAVMHTATLGRGRAASSEAASGAKVVLVTSAQAAEGKTTSIANLAASFAETGQSVLVLDADLRSPDLHLLFDVPQGAGISDFLYDPSATQLSVLARPTSVPGVKIITAGTQLAHPASLATRMGVLVEEARKIADVVLVDTAPLLAASDVFDLLPIVDTALFVVRSGRLTEAAAKRVSEFLGRFHVPVTGAILVATPSSKAYGYGYGYGSSADDAGSRRRSERKSRSRGRTSGRPEARTPRPVRAAVVEEPPGPAEQDEIAADALPAGAPVDFDPYDGYDPSRDAADLPGAEPLEGTRRQRRASSR